MSCLELATLTVERGHLPTAGELTAIRSHAADMTRAGVPIERVLSACHCAIESAHDRVLDRMMPGEKRIQDSAHLLFALAQQVSVVAATACAVETLRPGMDGTDGTVNVAALVRALLGSADASSTLLRWGVEVADEYLVVVIAADGTQAADAQEPLLTALQTALGTDSGAPLLASSDAGHVTVLLPGTPGRDEVAAALRRASAAAGAELVGAAVQAATALLRPAADQALDLLALASVLGRAPGLYGVAELALEYQLTRPGPGRTRLCGLLDPLDRKPELLDTLRVHLRNDLNRQRTAGLLHLHANTVDYRMRRIALLTGCDPGRPSGARRLSAAILVRDYLRTRTD
ncbi:PucR family transcriptional regulator [Rhodococcus sp. D2-41]|uniref:PucR family transcriptional regulator n=1 Tax=Speluncibacter jeojiensis TaxID=2710754 RepID=UPI00240ECEDB|nr:helix-turn-helix domain-containing protein [Rhodococcus sp. D2-41]MDG3008626.1 PucR family transcriptional regulator [Rhodococcus sp. D2-41]